MNTVPTILVVDDRAINREFLASLFGSVGYRVLLANDGAAALTMASAEHPDLVLSDILMPIMDGVEMTRRLHAKPTTAKLPVVFYTATYRLAEARVLAQSCGVTRVIAKPSAPRVILAAVARLLGRTPPPPAPTAPADPQGLTSTLTGLGELQMLPIRSALRTYGWLYLADKLGAQDFTLEDEQIAATFAAQLAITCENLTLIEEAQARTRALEQEVTERRASEAHLRQLAENIRGLNRVYAVLSGINAAIVRIHEPQALFEETCRVAVEAGQFALAWIGLREARAQGLRPLAWRSDDPRVTLQSIGAAEAAAAADTARSVLDDRRAAICNALPPSPSASTGLDFQSRALLPLSRNGTAIGVLTLYAREAGFFDAGEMRLLDELAGDISFALNYIAKDERLHHLAYYDALTGLPNRGLFVERLGQSLQLPRQDEARLAVILVDLDHFKGINDRLGRHLGDAVLKAVAQSQGPRRCRPLSRRRR